jgi:hypothetical protein
MLSLVGNSRPVFDPVDDAFYVTATADKGATWSYWRVTKQGVATKMAPAVSDLAMTGTTIGGLALIAKTPDGTDHLAYATRPDSVPKLLTTDPSLIELSPSFSPDGSLIVFGRALAMDPASSSGIWVIGAGGANLVNLATDGAYPRWIP